MKMQIGKYTRALISRDDGKEVVVITWPPNTRTPKHDHSARGTVRVLRGCVFVIDGGKKTYFGVNDQFIEVPDGTVHIVGNDGAEAAETHHVYDIGNAAELTMVIFPDDESDIAALASREE